MTTHESFKRRVRARMAATGERYAAARRVLIEQAGRRAGEWVSAPEVSDDAVREATGRGWNEWRDVIDSWPGNDSGHTEIARHVQSEHNIDGWWAQTVTVGYERITGRRLPNQLGDGTFRTSKSRTMTIDVAALREILIDDLARADLFPGLDTTLRSRPTAKALRIEIGPGIALFSVDPRPNGRVAVTVSHEGLEQQADVAAWRDYWTEWLAAIAESDTDGPGG